MPMVTSYPPTEPARDELDRTQGPVLVEFGAAWCGICKAAQPSIAKALDAYPEVQHIKVADGSGLPLGRSFRVKLWPTLIAMRDGKEIGRLVRPSGAEPIANLLASITSG